MTTDPTTTRRPADWKDQRSRLSQLVWGRVTGLQNQFCPDPSPEARAALAQLRRAATADQSRPVDVAAFAVDMYTQVPEQLYPLTRNGTEPRFGDAPTEAETAVRSAMILYAIHQQSLSDRMHTDTSPGQALGRLGRGEEKDSKPIRRRFAQLITADSYPELAHHLRTLVRMLRDHRIGMNYGQLAGDLFAWQYRTRRDGVRLSWSRDFENAIVPPKTDASTTEGEPTP